jgi:hypothetical protein
MDAPNEFQPLMDAIFREKVLRARANRQNRTEVSGLDLFEEVADRMRGGIRSDFPQFTEAQVEAELRRRLARVRQVQEHGFYRTEPAA